jgi:fructokinase
MTTSQPYDVVALGELVIDLVPTRSAEGAHCFAPKPGGAPGNVAVGVTRLGGRAAMLSKVGEETFGRLLIDTLKSYNVATHGVLMTREGNTSLAFVSVAPDGDREFMLYRNGCAESTYAPGEVDEHAIRRGRILHVGSLILGQPVSAAAQRHAIRIAREAGALVSVDVNLRPSSWTNRDDMCAAAVEAIESANILKLSKNELEILTGVPNPAEGIAKLWRPGLRVIAVTLGSAGAVLATPHHQGAAQGFLVPVVDTVGCGDAFTASLLIDLAAPQVALESPAGLEWLVRRACAVGALAATAAGAMEAMPTASRRDALLASVAASTTVA